jgi:sugar phosphate isomerase/epimerase
MDRMPSIHPNAAPIALQLYSVRDAAALDFRSVLERAAGIGFLGVELAGLHDQPPSVVRGWLDDLGLRAMAAHAKLPIGDVEQEILDPLSELSVDTLVVPWAAPERFLTLESIAAVAADLSLAAENAARRGISLGYHNHEFELSAIVDGEPALRHLFRAAPAVAAEVDVYWVKVGGQDPAAIIEAIGPTVQLLHLKDGPADVHESPQTAIGTGVIDFQAIVAASPDVRWHIVELDQCATDMFEAIEASYAWLVGHGLSEGRR